MSDAAAKLLPFCHPEKGLSATAAASHNDYWLTVWLCFSSEALSPVYPQNPSNKAS
jgi:hypothetical protein